MSSPKQYELAHMSWQLTDGCRAIFHKYCCYARHCGVIANLTSRNLWGILLIHHNTTIWSMDWKILGFMFRSIWHLMQSVITSHWFGTSRWGCPHLWDESIVIVDGQAIHNTWWHHQMETFPLYWPFVQGIRWSAVNSLHKGQWRGALICA